MNPIQKNISDALDLSALPPEEQEEIIQRVGALVYQNVLTRALEVMPESDQNDFEKLLDRNAGPEEIFMFLKNKVPDFEKMIVEEAEKLKNKTSSIMGQIGN